LHLCELCVKQTHTHTTKPNQTTLCVLCTPANSACTKPHPTTKPHPYKPLRSLHLCELCVYKTSPYHKITPYKPLRSLHLCELCVYKTSPYNKITPYKPLRSLHLCELCVKQNLTLQQNRTLTNLCVLCTSANSACTKPHPTTKPHPYKPLRSLHPCELCVYKTSPYHKITPYKPLRSLHLCELCVKQNLTKKQNKTKQIPSRNRTT